MSNRELCVKLLETVPDAKIGYVLAYIQGLTADEEADDAFCEALYREYEADPDKGGAMSFDEVTAMLGVTV